MEASDLVEERVTLEFRGSTAGTFLRYLILAVLSQLIFPSAWGNAILYRWLVQRVWFSDGTKAAFKNRAAQVWGWFALSAGLLKLPGVVLSVLDNGDPIAMTLNPEAARNFLNAADPSTGILHSVLQLGTLPILVAVELVIYRWIVTGIALSDGLNLQFTGRYFPLLCRFLICFASLFTIIGWAWAVTAFLRWVASKVEGAGVRFGFVGSGWGLLWRFLVAILPTLVLSQIPWMWVFGWIWLYWVWIWVLRRLIRNTVMVRSVSSPGLAAPDN